MLQPLLAALLTIPLGSGPWKGATTLDPGQAPPLQRIAFGSCIRQDLPQPIWSAVRATRPQLTILLGDNIYGDTDDPEVLRAKWARLDAVEGFRALREETTLLATWDDHDYGRDDAGAEYPQRKASQQVFLDFLGVPRDDPRRGREGVYHAETFGPEGRRVQVILLDTRYHRTPLLRRKGPAPEGRPGPYAPTRAPGATMLGEDQWTWLEARLREPAEVRLLATSIQLVADEHGWESWSRIPAERERLLALIASTGAEGVIALSGDRHAAELSILRGPNDGRHPPYPLVDITASSINQSRTWESEHNRHRHGDHWFGTNFGTLEIDWEADDPRLDLAIRREDGTPVIAESLKLSQLRSAPSPNLLHPKGTDPDPTNTEPIERITFGSCNRQTDPTPIWEDLLATDPELFLFLGDNVYADTDDPVALSAAYAQLARQPGYARLAETTPILATWDDHDYWKNDGGKEHPTRVESQRVFLDFFDEPEDSVRRTRKGVYGSWCMGPPDRRVQVILLDLRYHRDPWARRTDSASQGDGHPGSYAPTDEGTILGEAQWSWLEERLRVPARLRLIGSSVQCLPTGHQWECWAMRPHERQRLFDTIAKTRANGVVILSGDTHWSELSRVDPWDSGVAYPLHELTSSGLNQAWEWTNIEGPERVGSPLWEPNFGLVEIDWDTDTVRLESRARSGKTLGVTLDLQALAPPLH